VAKFPIAAVGLAILATVVLTPLVRTLARRVGLVDRPDQHRKLHGRAMPLGGGLSVLTGFFAGILALAFPSQFWHAALLKDCWFFGSLLASMLLICVLGLLDDLYKLRGRQKLLGQILAAGVLLIGGLLIEKVQISGWTMELGILAVPFTLFWLLGAVNALNLIDGTDGLAASVGIVLCLALGGMALLTEHYVDAILAAAFAGALAGFLVYNFPPATIFLGDAGSMLIGLVLGALAIHSSLKGPATIALAAPVAIWAIPALDVLMAILRRKLTGRSIYTTDRGHLHHSLLRRGYGGVGTLVIIGSLCAVTASAAVWSVYQKNEGLAIGSVLVVGCTLIVTRFFGHHEFVLVCQSVKRFLTSFVPTLQHPLNGTKNQIRAHLQGNRQWEDAWETLTDFAERFDLHSVQLNVQMPAIEEDFHARWNRKGLPDEHEAWSADIPLFLGDRTVGRLKITGAHSNGSVCTWMADLIAGLKPFETHMLDLLGEVATLTATTDVRDAHPASAPNLAETSVRPVPHTPH
jgi:UDP-GlcNAc:undecaprenyl-phosphate GlcNAc-1-phosphate transferase